MTPETVMSLAHDAMYVGLKLSAPLLLVALVVGLVVSLFQAATQINESTLSFIPKLLAVVLMLVLAATAHAATRNAGGSKPAALDEMADRRSVAADFCSKINHERKSKLSTTLSASVISVVNSRRP